VLLARDFCFLDDHAIGAPLQVEVDHEAKCGAFYCPVAVNEYDQLIADSRVIWDLVLEVSVRNCLYSLQNMLHCFPMK